MPTSRDSRAPRRLRTTPTNHRNATVPNTISASSSADVPAVVVVGVEARDLRAARVEAGAGEQSAQRDGPGDRADDPRDRGDLDRGRLPPPAGDGPAGGARVCRRADVLCRHASPFLLSRSPPTAHCASRGSPTGPGRTGGRRRLVGRCPSPGATMLGPSNRQRTEGGAGSVDNLLAMTGAQLTITILVIAFYAAVIWMVVDVIRRNDIGAGPRSSGSSRGSSSASSPCSSTSSSASGGTHRARQGVVRLPRGGVRHARRSKVFFR